MWPFWSEKRFPAAYENIYVRASREDWFAIVKTLAKELTSGGKMLDIGSGEGHTTKQILDRVPEFYTCDLLEPNPDALAASLSYLQEENFIGKTYCNSLKEFTPETSYDYVFTSHTNYYWSTDETDYQEQLIKFAQLAKSGGKALLLTLPSDSDHYKLLDKQLFPPFVYTEYIEKFLRQKGFRVSKTRFVMRLFVADMLDTSQLLDAKIFYRFIDNTSELPNDETTRGFVNRIREIAKNGYLDFKDELISISRS